MKKIADISVLSSDTQLEILKDYGVRNPMILEDLATGEKYAIYKKQDVLIKHFNKLNEYGKEEASKRVEELTEIPRYSKPDEPPQE